MMFDPGVMVFDRIGRKIFAWSGSNAPVPSG